MKLYYTPGSCSLSPHIVARELGFELELERVDSKTKKTAKGTDFTAINPKGYVPALELDSGAVLTEGPAIVQYLADQKPEAALAPPNGTIARYQVQAMLGYVNSELHKNYSPLFAKDTTPEVRAEKIEYLRKRYAYVESTLGEKSFLFGEQFTVADAYLFTVTNWSSYVKLDLSEFPKLTAFQARVAQRPAVQAALEAEGLLKR